MLRLAADGRLLETTPGLNLRLGASAFAKSGAYSSMKEQVIGADVEYGYPSDLIDFEITNLDQGANAQVVIPLANQIPAGAIYRTYANGQWQNFVEDSMDSVASAQGERGACPPPANDDYVAGLSEADGCLRLTLTDGGPNDSDGVADGVIRIIGGLAASVSARADELPQTDSTIVGHDDAVIVRMRLRSDSGDAVLNSLDLQASGTADDVQIDDVILVQGKVVASMADVVGQEGLVIAGLEAELRLQTERLFLKDSQASIEDREVTIMGDRELPYTLLKKVMASCTAADYGKISLAVTQKAPEAELYSNTRN